ncbi:hypothetical protein BT93_L1473 [Corymbia citriodora subsp. variegata]|uniref:SWIM-type domain-containing protein n=1 Tax=Corymbia citriodora subsp. variegata TaxID=360336 RepID=A0A8T0CMI3_CORYI|nr:hypothetical protein BT93_L1473 [Corymbia citriodora subsp. variegata]
MVFSNELEAYHKYVVYAIRTGFGVRKGNMFKNSKGKLTRWTFTCNCEGYSVNSYDKEKKYERYEVRCGCLACIKFKVDNGVYEVIEYIRSGRLIFDSCKNVLVDMAKAGIGGTTAYEFLANEAEGSKNLGFNLRDCQNYLQTKRSNAIGGGDCQKLLNHFHFMQMQNPMFSYVIQVDQNGRLTNLFWRDSLSKFDYDCFGDVLIFDTTYCTNRYGMICAPFIGVNHHWKNTLFGCALLLDETVKSFIWLFEAFLNSMGNKAPKTMFPNTQHRLCTWHIGKNAHQNIPHLYNNPGFKDKYFLMLMYRCRSEEEFESIWKEMEEEWGTENNKQLKHMREVESQDDYGSYGNPKLHVSHNGILDHAASVYTRTIFNKFNGEILQCLVENISSVIYDGSVYLYTLKCKGIQRENIVRFAPKDFSISCECKLFESKGWLCRHALKVLIENTSVTSISLAYILKRWTKRAKQGIVNDESHPMSSSSSKFHRFSTLMQESFELMGLGVENENTMRIVRKNMENAKTELSSYQSSVVVIDDASDDDNEASLCNVSIFDPLRKKGKGITYGRLKSSSEKKKKKSKKGISSVQMESQKLVVRATGDETHFPNYSSNSN